MIIRSELPKKFRITITLAVVTSLVFILKELMNDMFWVLVSADIGWIVGLMLSKIPSKKSKKLKEKAQIIDSFSRKCIRKEGKTSFFMHHYV